MVIYREHKSQCVQNVTTQNEENDFLVSCILCMSLTTWINLQNF